MRHGRTLVFVTLALFALVRTAPSAEVPAAEKHARALGITRQTYGKLPLYFEANEGQTASEVKFLSRGRGSTLFFTETEMILASEGQTPSPTLRMKLVGAKPDAHVAGVGQLPGRINYFIGNDPAKWRTNVATYAKVRYDDVYPGIDVVYYGNQRQIEYDFVVAPGADPSAIKLAFEGAEISTTADGDVLVTAEGREVRLAKPHVYQIIDGIKRTISGEYSLVAPRDRKAPTTYVGFRLAAYDTTQPLVIDPVLFYSTYLGGSGQDVGRGIRVGADGSAYITGKTKSANFPGPGSTIPANLVPGASDDVFVAKFDRTGSALVYSTYIGGGKDDVGTAIAIDSFGNAYITGSTKSGDFPTTSDAFDKTCGTDGACNGDSDAFVVKVDPSGGLLYSTYLGGSNHDVGLGIAADDQGNAYVTGFTNCPGDAACFNDPPNLNDFPVTSGAFNTHDPHIDSFVSKLSTNNPKTNSSCTVVGVNETYNSCADLLYSTYLAASLNNGAQDDVGLSIAVDSSGNVYVAGWTISQADFPLKNAFQTTSGGGRDVYVMKLKPDNSISDPNCLINGVTYNDCGDLLYSTFFGGNGQDGSGLELQDIAVAVDASGNIYVTGSTTSTNLPGKGGIAKKIGAGANGEGTDVFVAKFDPSQIADKSLVYSVYIGGTSEDIPHGISVDNQGNVYVTGTTLSTDFPGVAGATAPKIGQGSLMGDVFVTKLNAAGTDIVYSTYLGGSGSDSGYGIALDSTCNIYVTGTTSSLNFPLANPSGQDGLAGINVGVGDDAFVTKLTPHFAYRAYISNFAAGTVSVVDTQSQSFVGDPIPLPASTVAPLGVAVHPNGSRVYVTNFFDHSVSVIDTVTNSVIKTTSLADTGFNPIGIVVHPQGPPFPSNRIYVANNAIGSGKTTATVSVINYEGTLLDFDPFTDGIQGLEFSGVTDLFGVAVNPSGLEIYVTYQGPNGGGVIVAPLPTDSLLFPNSWPAYTIKVGDHPNGIAVVNPGVNGASLGGGFSYNGAYAFVSNRDSGTVSVLDLRNGSGVNIFNTKVNFATSTTDIELKLPSDKGTEFTQRRPFGIAVHPNLRTVYVADVTTGHVFVLDFPLPLPAVPPAQPHYPTVTVVKNYPANSPQGISVTPDGSLVYIANGDDSVSVLSAVTNERLVFTGPNANANGDIKVKSGDVPTAFGEFIGPPLIDKDKDGIWNLVDGYIDANGTFVDESGTPSTKFTNKHLCGTVSGEIVAPNGLNVKIGSPAGLFIMTGFSGGPAEIKLCDFTTKFFPNNVVEPLACGSLTARVESGPIEILLSGGGVLTVQSNVTFKVADSPAGTVVEAFDNRVTLHAGQSATLTSAGTIVVPDTIPPTTTATASPSSPNGAKGWYVTNVSVALAAADNDGGSGVKEIHYATSGAQTTNAVVNGRTASVSLSSEGTTTLTYFAVDKAGNQETPKTLTVQIDKTPPAVSCAASPNALWPPNHQLVPVSVAVTVTDAGSGPSGFVLTSVASSEPSPVRGARDPSDIQAFTIGAPSTSGQLRAERSPSGPGRVYTLTYRGVDRAGNSAQCAATVTVPHDLGR